jgi:WD40 repeat protein
MPLARLLVAATAPLAFLASLLPAAEPAKELPANPSYYRDVRPILQQHCQGCHQPARPQGGLVLTSHAALLKPADSGDPCVVPGKPDDSTILSQITPQDGNRPAMPQGRDPLTAAQVSLIRKWIEQGARDDTPATAKVVVDAAHPPTYELPPVLTALAFSPDGALLAVGGYHEVLLHKADGSGVVARLVGESERIESVAFSPDGKLLAVAGGAPGRFGEVQVWDVEKKALKVSAPVTFDTVYGVSWSPDGTRLAFGCADNTVRAIDAGSGKQVLYQGAHNDWVLDTCFSPKGTHVVSVSRDRSMKLTEFATQRFVDNITSITPGALKGGLISVAAHPSRDEVVVGGSDGVPKLFRIFRDPGKPRKIGDDFNLIRNFESMPGRIFSVGFDAAGERIVVGSSSGSRGEVRVYQAADGKRLATFEGQQGAVYVAAFAPDGKTVASAGFDGVVRFNDPQSGKLLQEFVPVPLGSGSR